MELVEVELLVNENIIKESLSRMGIANKVEKLLFPSCHLYEEDGKYYIAHFKELFLKTREDSYNNISEEDIKRKFAIITLLKEWKLIDIDDDNINDHDAFVYILKYADKEFWTIKPKFKLFDTPIED